MKVAEGDRKTFGARRDDALAWWKSKKVTAVQACSLVGVEGKDDLRVSHIRLLRGMQQAVVEGTTTVDSLLNPVVDDKKAQAEGLKSKVDTQRESTGSGPDGQLAL